MENDVLYNRIMNVVHGEYGSGSTAVANPEGEATDSLEKIQIGDDIYSVGGGSASGMLLTITQSGDDYVLDKTYTEIKTAIESGILPFAVVEQDEGINDINIVRDYGYYRSKYFVDIINMNNTAMILTFLADTEDGVLTMYEG